MVIQETADSRSIDNIIHANWVMRSASDGIQIQGDQNSVQSNQLTYNGGYGIHLCGPTSQPACVAPGTNALSRANLIRGNQSRYNALGPLIDNGEDNSVN